MKAILNKQLYITLLALVMVSCVKEDYFDLSEYGNIKSIEVSNQASTAVIKNKELSVQVEIPAGVDLATIKIQKLTLSSFASANVQVGDILDLNTPQQIIVTAENGTKHSWTIAAFVASATPQLSNGDLNEWYQTSSNYYEPGKDANTTIWGTGNPGTQILNKTATIPYDQGGGNLAAQMITLDNGSLAGAFGAPISTGSIFTGFFDSDKLDPSDPEAAIDFGTPFSGRPVKLKFKYQYQKGEKNKDKNGDELSYPDALDIYALLEIRLGGESKRLATAWFRNSDDQSELITQEVEFNYGELDASFPDYMKPTDHGYVSADSAAFVLPTHITFVASSSFDGANFAGAIGSTLIVDDIEMVYEK